MNNGFNRRRFLQLSGLAGVGLNVDPVTGIDADDFQNKQQLHSSQGKYLQKRIERIPLDADGLPEAIMQQGSPTLWTNWEKGPVEGLELYLQLENGVCWLGGPQGAARFDPSATHLWDRWQYFGAERWLSDNEVQNIAIEEGPYETVWIRTETAIAKIYWEPFSLGQKAHHFDTTTELFHVRNGFVARSKLTEPANPNSAITSDTDNDGLWTAMYLAAMAYRYAVTGEFDARMKARRAFDALKKLERITPIKGLYARTYRRLDEPLPHQDNGEWHPSEDGETEWKGDTSSDESVGHYYAYGLYYDLVADQQEKKEISILVQLITDYLIANNYDLIDVDGEPTRWGRWGEDYYESAEGDYEKALRSLELLSFLKTTYHITGDRIYQEAYLERVRKGYAHFTLEYRRWGSEEWEINFSDDELYYLSIYPLLKYEKDPALRALYMDSLRFTWNQVQPEMNPLWNYMSAALGAGPLTDSYRSDSRKTLERIPMELVRWNTKNSHRIDVRMNRSPDRHGKDFLVRVLPIDERPLHKHNGNPYVADGGSPNQLMEPTFWLLPYWMGVYYGYV